MAEPVLTGSIIGLVATNVTAITVALIRSRKHTKRDNGMTKDVGEIKTKVDCMDKKLTGVQQDVGIVKNDIGHVKENCDRHDREIDNNRKAILALAQRESKG